MYLHVKLLSEDEVGRGAGDGDEPADGGGVGDAERQAFADHVIPLGGILGVSPGFHRLLFWDFDGDLGQKERRGKMSIKFSRSQMEISALLKGSCYLWSVVCA